MELTEGTLLQSGEFKILKKLGQGGFGITYLAYQTSLNRKVAIKEFFMKDCCQRDESTTIVTVPTVGNRELVNKYKDKFKREAQFTAGLSHPNIVTIYSIFEENETVYYAMEFLSGGSLADYIKDRALPETEAVEYIKQISDALKLMHSNKENHLDVKPGNIMLRGNGNVVLIDFGLTKVFDDDGNPMTTTSSVATFTPHYAPIEQYKGIKEFSPETDIYSLGATLYRLVVGKVAPEADEILQDGLPPLPEHLSQNVNDAIAKSVQPRRSDRPKSIDDFCKILSKKKSFDTNNSSKTKQKPSLIQKLKIEFSRRHYVTNIVLVFGLLWCIMMISYALPFFVDVNNYWLSVLILYFLVIAHIKLIFNKNNGFILFLLYLIFSCCFIKNVGLISLSILGMILSILSLFLLKNNKSGYAIMLEKGSINIPTLFLSIYFVILFPVVSDFILELSINIRFLLGIEGLEMLRYVWIKLIFIITGFIGMHHLYSKKKTGIIWLITSVIFFIITSYYHPVCWMSIQIGFLDQGGFPLTFSIFIVIIILIGLFGRHQGQSIYSQMTKGNKLANIRNATLICITLLFIVFLSYVNFENIL